MNYNYNYILIIYIKFKKKINIKKMKNQKIRVHYLEKDVLIKSKKLHWPQNYDDFIKDITKQFNLNIQKYKINLKLITKEEDSINIFSQEELTSYINDNDIKEFKFSIEEIKEDLNFKDFEKLLDQNLLNEINNIDNDNIMKDLFGTKEDLKKRMQKEEKNYSNILNEYLVKDVNEMLEEKGKALQEEISKAISNYSSLSLQLHQDMNKSMMNIKDDLTNIKDEAEDIYSGLNEFNDCIQNEEIIININKENKKINIKFDKRKIETILDIKQAKFFNIDNIRITNIGEQSYENLCFYKDKANSSKDFGFFNDKNFEFHELTLAGEFEPEESMNFNISLRIDNAKPNQIYKMVIYVREKNSRKNLSDPFEICVRIINNDDPIQQRQNIANKIYEEFRNEFKDYEYLLNKNEIINQLLENNLNKEEIKKSINDKIKQIQKNKIEEEKAEILYKELNIGNLKIKKDEIIALIKEQNFNKENIQNLINKKKCEQIFDILIKSNEFDIKQQNKEKVFKKIIELNFNIDEIKKFYIEEEKIVNDLYKKINEDYDLPGFIDEKEAKQKFRELNCNKELIIEWIENELFMAK